MSKLSQPLKALINSPHARPDTIPAPAQIKSVYEKIARDASSKDIALSTWLSLTVCAVPTPLFVFPLLNTLDRGHHDHELARVIAPASWNSVSPACLGKCLCSRAHERSRCQMHWLQWCMCNSRSQTKMILLKRLQIPRSINCLNAFYAGLPSDVKKNLSTVPTRLVWDLSIGQLGFQINHL
jgi:hypothetical protein